MKAIICDTFGPPSSLKYGELPDPKPGPKDVLINIKACSVNFPDTLIIQGKYQFKPEFPFSPGSDVAGIVESVGAEVKAFKPGDKVIAMTPYGGYAEKVAVNYKTVFPIPPGMEMEVASSFLMTYGTSYHALKDRGHLKEGETLLVLGAAGGVGLTAVELGKLMGAKVIACASSDEKLQLCKEYGADGVINYATSDLREEINRLTDGKGIDLVYDPVGGKLSEPALRSLKWGGRHLVIGFAAGDIPRIPWNLPLLKGCQIVGVFWGSFAQRFPGENMKNTMEIIQWISTGNLKPHISKIYDLKNAAQALVDVAERRAMGKIIITMEE